MGMFDWLTGNIDERAKAAQVNTKAGTAALQSRTQQLGQQMQAQQYSLAASAPGGFSPLAVREAQRRSAQGQAQLAGQALQEQRMLEQQAAIQNSQNAMQAQQMNIDIAKHNSGGVMRGIGTAAGTAAMVFASDIRAKEGVRPAPGGGGDPYRMLSDFMTKEPVPVGSYIPQQAKPRAPASAFSNAEVQRNLDARREAAFDRETMMMAQAADQGPSAVQQLGVTPEQAQQAQLLRDSNQAIASAAQGSPAYGPAAGFQRPGQPQQDPSTIQKLLGFLGQRGAEQGGGAMVSDARAKELTEENAVLRAVIEGQQRGKGASVAMVQQQQAKEAELLTPEQAARPDLPEVLSRNVPGQPVTQLYPDVDMQPGLTTRGGAPVTDARRLPTVTVVRPVAVPQPAPAPQRPAAPYLVAQAPMPSDFAAKEQLAALDEAERTAIARVNAPTGMTPEQAHRALAPIDAVEYRYRPEAAARMAVEQGAPTGEAGMVYADKRAPRVGIIAQQLERSPAFAPAVVETPAGKAVERDRATSVNLAATAGLEKRQTQVEDEVARLKRLLGEGEQRAVQNIDQAGKRPKAKGAR